jgi:hypothetical protein
MSKFERYENHAETKKRPFEMLRSMLDSQSGRLNGILAQENFPGELLHRDATLNMDGYAELYDAALLKADKAFIREREIDFSSARNANVQKYYREEHGAQTEDEIIEKWHENKSHEKNTQMEMAITILLSQKLGEEFLVVRTSSYDDYKNGVDNLILDRITGEVIGAFDEVHEGGDGSRTETKKEKVQKIANNGGARIRYGIKLQDGKLVRVKLDGVPVFYLGLHTSALTELIKGLGENDQEKTDEIFRILLASLEEQCTELQKSTKPSPFRQKLSSFGQSLSRLKQSATQAGKQG